MSSKPTSGPKPIGLPGIQISKSNRLFKKSNGSPMSRD